MSKPIFRLYSHYVCPYAHRATWAAAEKGLIGNKTHESVAPVTGQPEAVIEIVDTPLPTPDWYNTNINVRETVPSLEYVVEGGNPKSPENIKNVVPESLIIAEFIDDYFHDAKYTRLLPTDARDRADVRLFISEFDKLIGGLYGIMFTKDEAEREKKVASIRDDIKFIESLLEAKSSGPYFLGETFSLADIAAGPFLERFSSTLPALRNVKVLDEAKRLQKLLEAVRQRPAFKQTVASADFYISSYKKYAE